MPRESKEETKLKKLPLHNLHLELGARMVPFAGFEMPVQYRQGIISEHNHTRAKAGLFDVSHMGQAILRGPDHLTTAKALEKLTPGAIQSLAPGGMRYTLLLNEGGGIIDDFMVTRPTLPDEVDGLLFLVVNAARKKVDFAHIQSGLDSEAELVAGSNRVLLALQGPQSSSVIKTRCPDAVELRFMSAIQTEIDNVVCIVSRAGYTGEDGFEISLAANHAENLARKLLSHPDVAPIGLGARDTLRLEAGLCLYGHDIDETTSPIEADLNWTIGKKRREAGDFPGHQRILNELGRGASRKRVGIIVEGRGIAREGTGILSSDEDEIGSITSGGFGPTFGGSIAMGYIKSEFAQKGRTVKLRVRNRLMNGAVTELPFVPHRYYRT